MTSKISSHHDRDKSRASDESRKFIVQARGALKESRALFSGRGWTVLPETRRGRLILACMACLVWVAYPRNPEAAVRRYCADWAPWLDDGEVDFLIEETAKANRRWTPDQIAAVLKISVHDRLHHGFRFLGCDDDDDHTIRIELKRIKDAARKRRERATASSGRKAGRPRLVLSESEILQRKADDAARKRAERAAKSSGRPRGRPKAINRMENASGEIPSGDKIYRFNADAIFEDAFSGLACDGMPSYAARLKRRGDRDHSQGGFAWARRRPSTPFTLEG